MATGDWCLIESDPGVFTELIRGFGVGGAQVEELWSLDNESFERLKPVHGLIFLYKWRANEEPQGSVVMDSRLQSIFFAKQVVKNACATQALLSVLLNVDHTHIELGPTLADFKEFASPLDPTNRGLCLTNSDGIRKVHNGFSRQQMFEFDDQFSKKEDAYHFVAYLPISGRLYELDGLQEGPIDHGSCDMENWLMAVKPVLEKRMQSYTADEIHFNLLAVVSDRIKLYREQMQEAEMKKDLAARKIQAVLGGGESMEDDSELSGDPEVLQGVIEECEDCMASILDFIAQEELKMHKYKMENIRRQHNYLPLIMELLKILARNGQLVSLCDEAKKRKETKRTAQETS